MRSSLFCLVLLLVPLGCASGGRSIRNDSVWVDLSGVPISCHDGGITRVGDTFYWYGTSYKGNPKGLWGRKGAHLQNGFNCYSSRNLVDWKYEGLCFAFPREGWLAQGTSHRPNVLFNEKTGKYVLWFFCIGTTEPEYPAVMLAVAVSDRPAGPFAFVGQRNTAEEHGWGQDLGLFKDVDGRGYLVYDDGHRNIRIDRLTDDFLSSSGTTGVALNSDGKRKYEGAALIRYKGKYIAAGSGVRGWSPTDTAYAVADSPLGPYVEMGSMSEQHTWKSQISNFVHIAESDRLLAMCDQWFRGPGGARVEIDASLQLWLPVHFDPATGHARMRFTPQWDPWRKEDRAAEAASTTGDRAQEVIREVENNSIERRIRLLAPEKARRLAELIRKASPRLVVEGGTAIGYSGLWIARELKAAGKGRLITLEIDPDLAREAQANFMKAGLADYVTVKVGDARKLVKDIRGPIDFVFLDCHPPNYHACFLGLEDRLRSGAVVVADNAGYGASGMANYTRHVRAKYNSRIEWFDINLPWAKRDAIEVTIIEPPKANEP